MKFKWDWEKRELVAGEGVEREVHPLVILGGIAVFMFSFIEYIAPFLGHLFFGGFL